MVASLRDESGIADNLSLSAKMKVFGREATRLSTILLSLLDLLVSAMIEFTLSCVVSGVADQILYELQAPG